jgi:hypothetical protein
MVKTRTLLLAAFGGLAAVLVLVNGHYLVRYVWLNAGQHFDDWTPLVPKFPAVRKVEWDNVTEPLLDPRGNGPIRQLYGQRLLVLQSYTKNIAEYAALSSRIMEDYCRQPSKNYRFKAIVSDGPSSARNPCWDKVFYIKKEFENLPNEIAGPGPKIAGTTDCNMALPRMDNQWIFWIDSDAAVDHENFSKYIEAIGNTDDGADLFICTSIYFTKNVNTGSMLLRVTPYMYKFLKDWWDWPNERWHQGMCHEQSALDEMIAKDHMGIVSSGKLALFECTEFNSTYQHNMHVKGKFMQHYRGCPTEKRKRAFSRIISGYRQHSPSSST